MKTRVFVLILLLMIPIAIGLSSPAADTSAVREVALTPDISEHYVLETLTIYNPLEDQCDDSPLITANNSRIDLEKLRRNEIRWMALSRDLLKRWNGEFNYGDTVRLDAGDAAIDGLWVINDNMNKRFKKRGDLLFHPESRTTGIWRNVKITKSS
jgi:hypothetical protein